MKKLSREGGDGQQLRRRRERKHIREREWKMKMKKEKVKKKTRVRQIVAKIAMAYRELNGYPSPQDEILPSFTALG